ncbi:MAG: hypothetical protein VYC91_03850 [Acidobacteriota bacterium]|nr:hypothetical protein [Acidobacteriota bacterium]
MKEETYACLVLSLVPGLGMRCLNQFVPQYRKLKELLRFPPGQVGPSFLSREMCTFISSGEAGRAADQAIQNTSRQGIWILSVFNKEYLHLLKQIFDPPANSLRVWKPGGSVSTLGCRGRISSLLGLWKGGDPENHPGNLAAGAFRGERPWPGALIRRLISALLRGAGRPSLFWAMVSTSSILDKIADCTERLLIRAV